MTTWGEKQAKLHDENRSLAVRVLKHIRVQLHKHDMEMAAACVVMLVGSAGRTTSYAKS